MARTRVNGRWQVEDPSPLLQAVTARTPNPHTITLTTKGADPMNQRIVIALANGSETVVDSCGYYPDDSGCLIVNQHRNGLPEQVLLIAAGAWTHVSRDEAVIDFQQVTP